MSALVETYHHLVFGGLAALSALLVWPLCGLPRRPWRYFGVSDAMRLVGAATMVVLLTLFATFTIDRSVALARSVPILQWSMCLAFLVLARLIARYVLARLPTRWGGEFGEREYVLLVGFNHRAEIFLRCVETLYARRLSVVGILEEDSAMRGCVLRGKPVMGRPSNLRATVLRLRNQGVEISRVVVTVPHADLSTRFEADCAELGEETGLRLEHFDGLLGIDHSQRPRSPTHPAADLHVGGGLRSGLQILGTARGRYLAAKRAIDITVAFGAIMLLAPLYLLVASLTAIDLGMPVTFWQERPGRRRRPFRVYKFRTMRDAYDLDGNEVPEALRVTRIGRMLRRMRLDELPQLFNILVGHMSFVGPRPLLPEDQPDTSETRLSIRPGLTGWAQIHGGRSISAGEKGVLDCWYVHHASLWLDVKIILLTLPFLIGGDRSVTRDADGVTGRAAGSLQSLSDAAVGP
ncbi:sugar transferase [Jiella sp. MQZ9-1]|uniref:Sugar transferase n=1 Tax=Jiella flava TaxID=2816857 RepID=A0A939JVG9_9HYPH|nr:sugar transferase [Jiella flava]MBO0662449.1 sugar transferase [Jiella flava]MCD2471674.1 sugar transferase [Jiella flava]